MRNTSFALLSAGILAGCMVFGCSASGGHNGFTASTSTGASAAGGSASSGGLGGTTFTTSGSTSTSSGAPAKLSAYAHTNTELFTIDPSQPSLAIQPVGTFDCVGGGSSQDGSMTDLAVDESGDVWGISAHNVYKLALPSTPSAGATVHCASTIALSGSSATFYGLTFAPAGVLGTAEVLVAANTAGQLWAIDAAGNLTQHGTFGTVSANDGKGHTFKYPGTAWELSGDIVFLANNGKPIGFATVRDCPNPPSSTGCNTSDTLVEIDLTALAQTGTQVVVPAAGGLRGQITKRSSCADTANKTYGAMYGIAAYESTIFGFSHDGYIVTIDNDDASACLALATSSNDWAGAAITTVAPVIVPPTM